MGLFLDTGNIEEIKKYYEMGVIRGVTTNPTILVEEGLGGDKKNVKNRTVEIANLINPLPLSIEVTSSKVLDMEKEATQFSGWAKNINVKIPIHGPEGEMDYLKLIKKLEEKNDIRVNVTAMMSAQQGFVAAMAGASYVSIFGGRVNDMGYNVCPEIKKLRKLIDDFSLKSKIIMGSTREALNVTEWLEAGAHIVTLRPKILKTMIVHPFTKETVKQFICDGAKLTQK